MYFTDALESSGYTDIMPLNNGGKGREAMKSSAIDPSATLDRLEKKFAKKLRNQKNKKHARYLRQSLKRLRGMSISALKKSRTSPEIDFRIGYELTSR